MNDKKKAYDKAWAEKNPDKKRASSRLSARRAKHRVMQKYGNSCVGCGEDELAVLTLDHINDDGAAKRRAGDKGGSQLYWALLKIARRPDLQVLCANCQARKRLYGPACLGVS